MLSRSPSLSVANHLASRWRIYPESTSNNASTQSVIGVEHSKSAPISAKHSVIACMWHTFTDTYKTPLIRKKKRVASKRCARLCASESPLGAHTSSSIISLRRILMAEQEEEFFTPRQSYDPRVSLDKQASLEEMLSCRSSTDPPALPNVPMPQPGIPFSVVEAADGGATESTNYQSGQGLPGIPAATFTIRNLITGEVIDLRDENESDFATRLAEVLTIRDDAQLEQHWYCPLSEAKRQMNVALWEAAQANDAHRCRELMDTTKHRGLVAQPNAKGLNNWTALHIAADQGHAEACEALLDPSYGVDVNARTSSLRTPLHLAVANGYIAVAQLLIDSHADISAVDFEDNTCLHMAAAKGNLEMTLWLLTLEPDVTIRNNFNQLPVDVACTIETRRAIEDYSKEKDIALRRQSYGRTPFAGVLIHNSRQDLVDRLLLKSQQRMNPQALQAFTLRVHSRPRSPAPDVRQGSPQPSPRQLHFSDEENSPSLPPPGPSDFTPVSLLGKGSFGEVYLVRRVDTGEQLAMKVLSKEKIIGRKLQRYALTERRIMSYIHHPFVISLRCAFQTPQKLVLVMPYCPGRELSLALSKEKKFTEERARMYICELVLALEELHRHHVVYRDLKPENVLLDAEGHVVLTDFGLAKEGVGITTMTNSFCGSPAYLAPEVLKKLGHSQSVDWYILGVLLFEMLTGMPPFFSSNRELMFQNIQRAPLKFPKTVSANSKDLVTKLVERDPEARLGSGVLGVGEIKQHPFFTGIDWEAVYRRELKPPVPTPSKLKLQSFNPEQVFGDLSKTGEAVAGWSFIA